MDADLLSDVLSHLHRDFAFKETAGDFLRQGTCPSCSKKELYTSATKPWVLRCGRLNKCGYEGRVKELYPDLFNDWSTRAAKHQAANPTAPINPNAAADAYLASARGFSLSLIAGWYRQESYYSHTADNGKGAGTATVRFPVGDTWWERLIDRPWRFGKTKARFRPGAAIQGQWWQPPTLPSLLAERLAGSQPQQDGTATPTDGIPGAGSNVPVELWINEGIFDAVSLLHHGILAVAAMSSAFYPEHALAQLLAEHPDAKSRITLVWALDGDTSGAGYTIKHVRRAREEGWTCTAAQPDVAGAKVKRDWNDLHLADKLSHADLDEYRHLGALLISASPAERALLMHQRSGKTEFPLVHGSQLYWFKLDVEKYQRARTDLEEAGFDGTPEELRDKALATSSALRCIANCAPQALYFQKNETTGESWYFFNVRFPGDQASVKDTFSASAISAGAEFKKRLLAIAPGALYTGTTQQLDWLMGDQLRAIQRVETVDYIGYSREYGVYLLGDVAVSKGTVIDINDDEFFEVGKLSIKSLNRSVDLKVNTRESEYSPAWWPLLWRCFGAKGAAALAFWLGSLFAEQIRAEHKSYAFMEVVGEAGAGKSTLIEFMWKLLGRRDYEGFDPSKSSLAARARNFAQVAGLPVVLIESDRERLGADKGMHVKSFDWDELKTAYNGRSVRARGMATSGNETYEPPFRGAIVISQNNEVNASEAILQRIVHLHFDREGQTAKTREAAVALEQTPIEDCSGWILRAVRAEAEIMRVLRERTPVCEAEILARGAVKVSRIAKNHGQLMALAECLPLVTPIDQDQADALREQIHTMAAERQQAISQDHPIVAEFWDAFEYLDEGNCPLNHSRTDDVIAINLNHFVEKCKERGQPVAPISDLKKVLKNSKRHPYVEQRVVNSAIKAENALNKSGSAYCWVFQTHPTKATAQARTKR